MDIQAKQELAEAVNTDFVRWRDINRKVDRVLLAILFLAVFVVGSALLDNLEFLDEGINGVKYHDFDELLAINPDTVAWITIDDTHIDDPVVQGKDNFEYLDKAFEGHFYAGGTLFLDYMNSQRFEDPYSIIHGHHMPKGAMFGDLAHFLEETYFATHRTGTLLTPTYDYDLEIIAAGIFDAYDGEIYAIGETIPSERIMKDTKFKRKSLKKDGQILALSTCSGDMNDDRIVVFCRMINKHKHQ